MNTSFKLVAILGLLFACQSLADSTLTYDLELGGNNHPDLWEAYEYPDYTRTTLASGGDGMEVNAGDDVNWAVIVDIAGTHNDPGELGDTYLPGGAANLVFDLELREGSGTAGALVNIGHATLSGGVPQTAGWYSSINDGDADGDRGGIEGNDPEENAAFCMNFDVGGAGYNGGRLFDLAADGGPNMDFYNYPAAQGLPVAATAAAGTCMGMGAGYKEFKISSGDTAGVGLATNSGDCVALTVLPLFEGQINTTGLNGTYTLILKATTTGNNVLPGHSTGYQICNPFWGGGRFAIAPNNVAADTITFTVAGDACPAAPAVSTANSCKAHGTVGEFCIDVLNRTGDQDIEGRWSGPATPAERGVTKLVVGFDMSIAGVGGLDTSDVSLSPAGSVDNVSLSAADELTIQMSSTTDGVATIVSFPGICKSGDEACVVTDTVCIRQLLGTVRTDGSINAADRVDVRNQVGLPVTGSNFRADVRADGTINAADRVDVRNVIGNGYGILPYLPEECPGNG